MKRASTDDEPTHVLNVDLDIVSSAPLDRLVQAWGEKVDVLHVGKWGRRYGARLEVGGSGHKAQADRLINRFVALVEALPKSARLLWNRAQSREFNVGIEAARASPIFEWRIPPRTLSAVARVSGRIIVTVYAPERLPGVIRSGPPKKRLAAQQSVEAAVSPRTARKAAAKRVGAKPTVLAGGNPQIAKADGDAPVQAYRGKV